MEDITGNHVALVDEGRAGPDVMVGDAAPNPQTIRKHSKAADIAQIVLGVDGNMSAGFVPYLVKQTIHIMPDSPSSIIFESWAAAEKVAREKFFATATILIPSISRKYTLSQGALSRFPAIAAAKKVLEGRQFEITWGDVSPAVTGPGGLSGWINTASATAPSSPNGAFAQFNNNSGTWGGSTGFPVGMLALTGAVSKLYLSVKAVFSSGTCAAFGCIFLRRRA